MALSKASPNLHQPDKFGQKVHSNEVPAEWENLPGLHTSQKEYFCIFFNISAEIWFLPSG